MFSPEAAATLVHVTGGFREREVEEGLLSME